MKKNLLIIGSAVALLSACDADKIVEANNNPNSPTDAPSTALFTNAVRVSSARWLDGVGGTRYGFLPQHLAEVQYPDDDTYARLAASSTSGLFDGSYNSELQDLRLVDDRGVAANLPGLWAPARVLSSWEFGVLTDVFGDVPYTEAFSASVLRPKYDLQKDIYDSLFSKLTAASTALASATNELGADGDPIYGGDPVKWRKLANSLRLRHAMRLYNVAPATAAAQAAAAIADAGGLILTNADNAALVWPGDGIYDSPWAANFKGRDDHRISMRLVSVMSGLVDPRIAAFAMPAEQVQADIPGRTLQYCPTVGTCYVGLMNAMTQALSSPLASYTSRPGAVFYPGVTAYGTFGGTGAKYPTSVMTAAEVELLLAEAAERGVVGAGVAATHYGNGITLSMAAFGITGASVTTYIASGPVAYAGTTGAKQTRIATQMWLALYTDPLQAWMNVRRTCVPGIVEPGPNSAQTILPRRLQYSTTEAAVNSSERLVAVNRQWGVPSGDKLFSRVYWDPAAGWSTSPTYVLGCSDKTQ